MSVFTDSFALALRHYGGAVWRRALRLADRLDHPLVARCLYRPGLPPGLEPGQLEATLERAGHGRCRRIMHRHISGWKETGAYRLHLDLAPSGVLRLVYKNGSYRAADFPALDGLGLHPGPGEYAVYRHLAAANARFLPDVLFAEELEPRQRYHYLMVDLVPAYRVSSDRACDLLWIVAALPELQAELGTLGDRRVTASMVTFDHAFALRLLMYARDSLEAYAASRPGSEVADLLAQWDAFDSAYRRGADLAYGSQPVCLIHGDYNPNNVMLPRRGGDIKAIDFEWFGWGLPQMDLASALKGAPTVVFERCAADFARRPGAASPADERAALAFCVAQRALFDAAFIAKQMPRLAPKAGASFERILLRSAYRAGATARVITAGSDAGGRSRHSGPVRHGLQQIR